MNAAPAIETVELAKRYGRITALAGLSMRVERGSVFGFLGPNGAGKTTAVKLLLGLATPTSGEAFVLGAPISDRGAHLAARREVGYLPELFRYQSWLSAREVLAAHCALARIEPTAWPGEISNALTVVGLTDRADDRVATFSKGMQQRLGLAVALLGSPDLVVLDEPTSALDPVGRHDVRGIIAALRARGMTVFLNSHLLSEVERVCDRVAIVDRGTVIAMGGLSEVAQGRGVRVRVTGIDDPADGLSRFGEIRREGEWLVVAGLARERVPDLVEALVALGGRVYAVEPEQASLEERFLRLIRERAS